MKGLFATRRIKYGLVCAVIAVASGSLLATTSQAAQLSGDFALEVSPSPIVTSVKPGVKSTIELKIHNIGIHSENLKIEARQFSINQQTGAISISDQQPEDASQWISFAHPTFSVDVGQWYTQDVTVSPPKDSGFSYSFAILISRASTQQPTTGGRLLNGSLADFTLINVDRPGANRKIEIGNLTTDHKVYEFLPANINVTFKNTGNTIAQPQGNIFIQRGNNDTKPLATLPVNPNQGYILANSQRTFTTSWDDGFPTFKTTTTNDGSSSTNLAFDWDNLSHFRFGEYTVKLVAYYNDGQRDIPIESEVTFWVIPYKTISAIVIILIILFFIRRYFVKRRTEKAVKKALAAREKQADKPS